MTYLYNGYSLTNSLKSCKKETIKWFFQQKDSNGPHIALPSANLFGE